jgi:hypothetical protein
MIKCQDRSNLQLGIFILMKSFLICLQEDKLPWRQFGAASISFAANAWCGAWG